MLKAQERGEEERGEERVCCCFEEREYQDREKWSVVLEMNVIEEEECGGED
jgi:hypothetical protein